MPKAVSLLRLFVGSPGDLDEERNLVAEVVEEFNLNSGDLLGVRLELVRWETYTHPGFGEDAQDVINQQIGDDYDIFVGLMWARFGSPTNRAESGTAEEFQRALTRFKDSAGAVQVMVYFKNAPIAPDDIDIDQLAKVKAFKEGLSRDYGGLFHQFSNPDDFRTRLRIHLTSVVKDCLQAASAEVAQSRSRDSNSVPANPLARFAALTDDDYDEGIIELNEAANEAIAKSVKIAEHISDTVRDLGTNIHQRANEIEALKSAGVVPDQKTLKRVADGAAGDLELYVKRLSADLPVFNMGLSYALEAYGKVAMLAAKDLELPESELEDALTNTAALRSTLVSVCDQISDLRTAIAGTPRMTTLYNKARKRAVAITDDFVTLLKLSEDQVIEVERVFRRLLHG